MKTSNQTSSNSIFNFNEDQWNQMPGDISSSVFSDVADSGGNDIGILGHNEKPSTFTDKEYLAMRLTSPSGLIKHLIYLGGSNNDPLTWNIEKDIASMESGAYASFGAHGNECLITSCLKTAVFLRFRLDMSVVCSFNIKNTNGVVENIQRLSRAKGNKSPVLFVLCEDIISVKELHEAVIELEPRHSTLISLACNQPALFREKIDSAFKELKGTQKYRDLVVKIERISQYESQKHLPGGAKLFKDIYHLLKKHIEIRDSELILSVLYILFTYVFRKSSLIPILCIVSPEAGAGKTILLSVMKILCANPIDSSDVTPAILAEYASTYETVIIDEFDQNQKKEGITAIINAGYRPAVANHTRLSPGRKAIAKNLASARIIAGIGYPEAPTIRDRSIFVNLQVCKSSTKFPDVDLSGLGLSILKEECEKLAPFAKERFALQSMDEDHLKDLKRRLIDNYNCLLKVANCLGDEIFMMAVGACQQNAIDEKPEVSINVELIIDILKVINIMDKNSISRDQLAESLISMPGRPWKSKSTRDNSFSLEVGKVLKTYRISTGTVRIQKIGNIDTAKGYKKTQFKNLMERLETELNNTSSVDID